MGNMIEKVSPAHPDKVADRIAGAIVDYCYTQNERPKVAVEVLIGHGVCHIIVETSEKIPKKVAQEIVNRIAGNLKVDLQVVKQDKHLAGNQAESIKCGDNGIFKGVPLTKNEEQISVIAHNLYLAYPYDGKYILTDDKFICCQSNAKNEDLEKMLETGKPEGLNIIINPLGEWTGGTDVDSGATNRKLGSDMAQSVTGGGLHGKDLSKADVSVNIYAFKKAQELGKTITMCCAIGDEYLGINVEGEEEVEVVPYTEIVKEAEEYIKEIGGFEKFAEWGLY